MNGRQLAGLAIKQRVREAVAVLIHGRKNWKVEDVAAVAVFDDGRWFSYPHTGTWSRNPDWRVTVTEDQNSPFTL